MITEEFCLTGNLGFFTWALRHSTTTKGGGGAAAHCLLSSQVVGALEHTACSWHVGPGCSNRSWQGPCPNSHLALTSLSCTRWKQNSAKNLNQIHCKTHFICKLISINFNVQFNQITSFNIPDLSLAISLSLLYFAHWTGDYTQEQGLHTSVGLAVSIKMALYQFLLTPLNLNILLVIFHKCFLYHKILVFERKKPHTLILMW